MNRGSFIVALEIVAKETAWACVWGWALPCAAATPPPSCAGADLLLEHPSALETLTLLSLLPSRDQWLGDRGLKLGYIALRVQPARIRGPTTPCTLLGLSFPVDTTELGPTCLVSTD